MAKRQVAEKDYKHWMGEIESALKREKSYRQTAQKCVDLYEAKKPDETPFAILYSNTEVLAPAVYNARPIPIATRRFRDPDPIGKAASEVLTRTLKFLIDTESEKYDNFDDLMSPAVLDGLVTNRGLTRFKYVPQQGTIPECVCGEAVRWDKFLHGYARTWKKVPWIGFEWDMSKEEIKKNFPYNVFDFTEASSSEDDNDIRQVESKEQLTGVTLYKVYEVWDKASRSVKFFSHCFKAGALREVDDPLGLSGFFPIPKPLNFMRKITTLTPTPLYEQYRSQAAELNEITRRLKAIIRAIKYRGAYNNAIEGIEKVLQADDNVMVPVENMQSMPENMGLDKMLWTVPVQELAQTAQQLYQQREQVKQVIYEITGISDILRGASVASETATAQQIKNQWGSLRLKRMQKEVQRYCRESLAIMAEIASSKFELTTLEMMTGLPFLHEQEKMEFQQKLQMAQQAAQVQGQEAPAVPPEMQGLLEAPSWEQIGQLLRSDMALHYKVDIETNSTIDAEASQDKQDISELLNALSQFLNGIAPLVQNGFLPFDIAKGMMLTISRRYNFGSQLEDSLNSMGAAQPKDENAPTEAEKAQQAADAQKAQIELQMLGEKAKLVAAETQSKITLMQEEAKIAQMELQIKIAELQLKEKELALQERGIMRKLELQDATHEQKMRQLKEKETAAAEAAEKEPAHANV